MEQGALNILRVLLLMQKQTIEKELETFSVAWRENSEECAFSGTILCCRHAAALSM
jgi:hypothetical protein